MRKLAIFLILGAVLMALGVSAAVFTTPTSGGTMKSAAYAFNISDFPTTHTNVSGCAITCTSGLTASTITNGSTTCTNTTSNATSIRCVYNTYTVTNNRDERGEIITLTPDVIVLNPALRFTAQEILNSTLIPGSMDNDTNVLNSIVDILPWSQIGTSDDWILGKKKMGLMATDRQDVNIDFWQDETSKDYFASIFTRFGGCVTNWRYWYSNNLPTS